MLEAMGIQTLDREAVRDRLRELLEARVEVLEAYFFGSMALDRAQEHSDVDVAVIGLGN